MQTATEVLSESPGKGGLAGVGITVIEDDSVRVGSLETDASDNYQLPSKFSFHLPQAEGDGKTAC